MYFWLFLILFSILVLIGGVGMETFNFLFCLGLLFFFGFWYFFTLLVFFAFSDIFGTFWRLKLINGIFYIYCIFQDSKILVLFLDFATFLCYFWFFWYLFIRFFYIPLGPYKVSNILLNSKKTVLWKSIKNRYDFYP